MSIQMLLFQGTIPLGTTIDPATLDESLSNGEAVDIILTALPTGGVSPYTYVWSITTGAGFTLTSTTTSPTHLQRTGLTNTTRSVTVHLVVTDNVGATATADASGTITWGVPP